MIPRDCFARLRGAPIAAVAVARGGNAEWLFGLSSSSAQRIHLRL
jgi:hypothetical protein